MKTIPLTNSPEVAIVDDEDFEVLSKSKWVATGNRDQTCFYAQGVVDGKKVLMHRVIAGGSECLDVDHRDGNGLNNQKRNLRPCTRSENLANRLAFRGSQSKFKGVNRDDNAAKPWRARVRFRKSCFHLGYFKSQEEAAKAYDAAAREIHGKFACLNFPKPGERSAITGEIISAVEVNC